MMSSDTTRGNGQLQHKRCCQNIRQDFLTVQVTEPWNRLPTDLVESHSLKIIKSHLDFVLSNWH